MHSDCRFCTRRLKPKKKVEEEMVRAACCDKVGMKKGPWSPQEDEILMSYIRAHGHTNWRALPKAAGLVRCGKSCRLRWTNYLRPDIKRGNFTLEEEEAIINLHHMLGNRWSAIAAQLPGRTDNEIKNVWNTHLKKRQLINPAPGQHPNRKTRIGVKAIQAAASKSKTRRNKTIIIEPSTDSVSAAAPSESYSCRSDIVSCSAANSISSHEESMRWDHGPAVVEEMIEESFWTQTLFTNTSSDAPSMDSSPSQECLPSFPPDSDASIEDGMSFWYRILVRAGDLPAI